MFDQSFSYQGGVQLAVAEPASVAEQAVAGLAETEGLLHAEPPVQDTYYAGDFEHGDSTGSGTIPSGSSPNLLLKAAEEEARRLVDEARAEAEAVREQLIGEASAEADRIRAKALSEAATIFGSDLWSSKHALSIIVSEALQKMIGTIGEEEATLKAVEHAIMEYCRDKMVVVRAERNTANRLRLSLLSRQRELQVQMLKIEDDDLLEKGRCVVGTGNTAFEVSVKSQIQTINNVAREAVAVVSASNERGGE